MSVHPAGHPADQPTRRCWRCLQEFPLDPLDLAAADGVVRPAEWWVCEACHDVLFTRSRTGDTGT